jgi:hypothetical protein
MSISSSNSARTAVAGWIDRFSPSWPDSPPRPLRRSSSGVWTAPQATTTASHSTRSVPPPAVVASTPRARPPSITIFRARTPDQVVAPASQALGT